MMELERLQAAFKHYLFSEQDDITDFIVSTAKVNSCDRLSIYANAYRSRLVEALAKDYPALHYLVGEDEFRNLALAYTKAYPSTHFSLRWFGECLAHFLDTDALSRGRPYLAELARFEWAFVDAFDAKDEGVATTEDAAKVAPELWPELRITLHPSVRLVACAWNCLAIWKASMDQTEAPAPQRLATPVAYLIWRRRLDTKYRSLEPDGAVALELLSQGSSFAELCETLAEWNHPEQTALRAASLLKIWLGDGLVAQLRC